MPPRPTWRRTGRTAGAQFHKPVRVGRLWIGPPWEEPDARRDRGRDRPGPRLRHRRTPDDAALSRAARGRGAGQRARRRLWLRRPLDRGGEARLRPGAGVRLRPAGGRGERAERGWTTASRSTSARPTCARTSCPRPTSRSRTSPPRRSLALSSRLRAARVITSGYLVSDDPELDGLPRRAPRPGRRLGCGPPRASVSFSPNGELLRQVPRLQGLADRRAGAARAARSRRASRGRRTRRRRGREHLLRHERGPREVAPGRLPRGSHARSRLRDRVRRPALGHGVRRPARRTSPSSRARSSRPSRRSPATWARSAACRPTRGSTGYGPSSRSRTAARSRARSA